MDVLSASDKVFDTIDEALLDQIHASIVEVGKYRLREMEVQIQHLAEVEAMSIATTSVESTTIRVNSDRPLFPRLPPCATPAAAPLSEDEDEVPTRNVLKKQAQLLVDTKSRRKGFAFRR
ncbi:PREDICTED: uncharacterized protein LOC105564769 [Vollenhovia emeryi]|uniref:uncharacterized protein LOC105564769 n=1 Tax=Vollenhovia emeryi TaxID=411798 RepID=UPI0005F3B3AD|nr:PREDICTED: uncharacterized protein LOC105564769 [Vollenhovia emeryi]